MNNTEFQMQSSITETSRPSKDDKHALYNASKAGQLATVQDLIRAGADVNLMCYLPRAKAATALQAACVDRPNSIEVVRELLKAGADVTLRNSYGETALWLLLSCFSTSSERKEAIARLLLEAKCDVNVRVGDKTVLSLACDDDIPTEIFSLILASGADLTTRYSRGMNALHECICHGASREKIECLLKNGISTNAKNWLGETPLHIAAKEGDTMAMELLLRYNANILARTYENNTVLMEVLRQDDTDSDDDTDSGDESMSESEDQITSVRLILAKMNPSDKFLDVQNNEGWTALHFAAHRCSQKVIHELLNWKTDITRRTDKNGHTALHIFVKNAKNYPKTRFDVLKCLVEHENGYREDAINLQDYDAFSALHLALKNCLNDSMLQYLSRAVDVRITDRTGETSLHAAVQNYEYGVVIRAMLDSRHGTEAANIQNPQGMTALQTVIARREGIYEGEVVRALSRVTNVNAQDRVGKTALHYALMRSRCDTINILLYERNADPSIQDCEGNTPLSLACEMENDNSQLSLIFQLYQYGLAYGTNMV